jgi:hypothetical protein
MKKGVLVSSAWVVRNWKMVNPLMKSKDKGFFRYSPKRIVVEICRTECGYSDNTAPMDIWAAIERRYKEVQES